MKKRSKGPAAPTCTECGGAMTSTRRNYRMPLAGGKWAVTVEDVQVLRCGTCGEESVVFERLEELLRAVAATVIRKPGRLAGEEIAFLRTMLEYTGQELADILAVTPGTISRWERGHEKIGGTPDRLLRAVVALKLPEAGRFEVESLGKIGEPAAALRLVVKESKGHWQTAA